MGISTISTSLLAVLFHVCNVAFSTKSLTFPPVAIVIGLLVGASTRISCCLSWIGYCARNKYFMYIFNLEGIKFDKRDLKIFSIMTFTRACVLVRVPFAVASAPSCAMSSGTFFTAGCTVVTTVDGIRGSWKRKIFSLFRILKL